MNDDDGRVNGQPKQQVLFENPPQWTEHWRGMPEYRMLDKEPRYSIEVHFRSAEDRKAFADLTDNSITDDTKSVWFPRWEHEAVQTLTSPSVSPRYPVYVISKGRWESRLTSKALEAAGIPYSIVVEPQEYGLYSAVIDPGKIFALPFSNLGQGSIPTRNWVWEHSLANGDRRHWILDDNIDGFIRQNLNVRSKLRSAAGFLAIEDFVDRYENIGLAGMNYRFLGGGTRSEKIPPYLLNTRIYSCILIDNSLPFRWRGRYNEDTDLSLRVLKSGLCTVLFNAFKVNKSATMTMPGGNTDELYQDDGRLEMAESLRFQHPDVVTVSRKWGRWQHHVDYTPFSKNTLVLKPDAVIPDEENEYGMIPVEPGAKP